MSCNCTGTPHCARGGSCGGSRLQAQMSYNYNSTECGAGLRAERSEMQGLNDRLECFMSKVRALRQQKGATIDPASFLDTLKMMEDEMNRCKATYEAEIAKLRYESKHTAKDVQVADIREK